jgi:hypothetical protein
MFKQAEFDHFPLRFVFTVTRVFSFKKISICCAFVATLLVFISRFAGEAVLAKWQD